MSRWLMPPLRTTFRNGCSLWTGLLAIPVLLLLTHIHAADQSGSSPATESSADSEDARKMAELEKVVHRYFSTWSNRDHEGYGSCFVKDATIHHISERGEVSKFELLPFLNWQRQVTRRANPPMTETAETIDIQFEQQLARVVVYWKLVAGSRVEYGYDHFTYVKQKGEWKIINLIFYGVPSPPR